MGQCRHTMNTVIKLINGSHVNGVAIYSISQEYKTRMMSNLINAVQRAKKRRQNTATASFIRRPAMENMTVLSANPKRKHRKTNFHKNPSRRWFWSKKTPISTLIRMKWSTAAMGKQLLQHSGPEASKFQRKSAIGFAS